MAYPRWGLWLPALLLVLPVCLAGTAVRVGTAEETMAALAAAAAPGATPAVLELTQDVALSPAAAASYRLPFVVPANQTLTIRGGGGQLRALQFGGIPQLLFFETGSKMFVDHVAASGSADPHLGSWPESVVSPTIVQSLPLWPTIGADTGFDSPVQFDLRDSTITLHPTAVCTPEIGVIQYDALRALARAAGTNMSDIDFHGTVAHLVSWSAPLPVLSPTTKVAVGSILAIVRNTTIYCSLPDNSTEAPAPAPATDPAAAGSSGSLDGSGADGSSSSGGSSEGGGGGTPGWVWAVVGVAAAAAVAAVAAGLVWRRRRALRRQQPLLPSHSGTTTDDGKSVTGSKPGKLTPSDGAWSGVLPSAGNSGIMEFNGGKTALPEGPWRSRVGFIDGLQLGGLIGRGGYARVYKGRWKGTSVAVKVAETVVGHAQRYDLRDEPLLSLSLSHPNVLQGYKMCVVRLLTCAGGGGAATSSAPPAVIGTPPHSGGSAENGSGSGGKVVRHLTDPSCMVEVMPSDAVLEPGMYEMWLVSELADKGTLADAMKAGRFATQADPPGRNLPMILLCLLDVARGLEYLHSCNIMHGDLKPQNVLLKTASSERRGFVCKLCDFGLSRILRETETHVDTGSYGTVTHAAPELLQEGRLTKASDVFAFGVMLWELVTGQRLFAEMHHMQIIIQVTQQGYRPPIPDDFPAPLAALLRRCWAERPADRPRIGEVVREMMDFCSSYGSAATSQGLADAAAAATAAAAAAAAELLAGQPGVLDARASSAADPPAG